MRTGQLLVSVMLCAWGCHRSSEPLALSVKEYDSSYNTLMQEYEKELIYQTHKSFPSRPKSGPLGSWFQEVADGVLAVGTATHGFVERLDSLRPPPERLAVHRATRSYLELLATDNVKWAATIRTGDDVEIDKQQKLHYERDRKALERYKAEARRVGYVVPDGLEQWPPKRS